MSRRPPYQSTPHGSKHPPELSRMNPVSNNPRQSAPADQQQRLPPLDGHYWRPSEEIDALVEQRVPPKLPTNEDWHFDSGRAGGLTSSTAPVVYPDSRQHQSRQSEIFETRQYGLYDDPPSRGYPSTAPPPSPYSHQYQNRQGEILETGQYGLYGDPPSRGFPSIAPPPSPYSHQDQSRQSEIHETGQYGLYDDPPSRGLQSTAPPDIRPQHCLAWSPREDGDLKDYIVAKKTYEWIAEKMGRSEDSISHRWARIKGRFTDVVYDPPEKYRKRRKKKEEKKPLHPLRPG